MVAATSQEFPATLYKDFLQYVAERYAGQFWHALPRQVAQFALQHKNTLILKQTMRSKDSCTFTFR